MPVMNRRIVPQKPKGKWPLELILEFYDACMSESQLERVADAMGKDSMTIRTWLKNSPEIRLAWDTAAKRRGNREHLADYIYGHLSDEAKQAWDKIQFWDGHGSMRSKVDTILKGKTTRLKQELFIHALVRSGFNMSEACRMVAIPRTTLDAWGRDEGFRKLVQEIHWHKKNYFEHALMDLVAMRHPVAVLFVNRTINADRGYGEKVEVHHTLNGEFSLDDLDLDLDTRKKILEAVRARRAAEEEKQKLLPAPRNGEPEPAPIDV